MLTMLKGRGMRRVLTEGGPMLLDSFIRHDMLDELCLTIAPYIVGGLARRIATGPGQLLTPMRCAHVFTDDAGLPLHPLRQGLATVVGMSRQIRSATILMAVTRGGRLRPGPGRGPALRHRSGARPQGVAIDKPPPSGPPPIAAPKNDLSWHDCTSRVFADAGVPAAPGVQLDCANYDADLDPVNGGTRGP